MRAYLKTLDTDIDIDQLPWATAACATYPIASYPSCCALLTLKVAPATALPSSPLSQQPAEQQQTSKQSEGAYLIKCASTRDATRNHSHSSADALPPTTPGPRPSICSSDNGSGSLMGDHSTDSPLPPVGRCGAAPALRYSPFYPDREWPEWAGHMSPLKEWIDARMCIEEWPEWAGNMSPPEDWDKDRVIMGDGIQPTHLVYQFITCNNEALEDSCLC